MSVALFTEALEELVADATLLPVQVDPVRPPAIPGAVVGPPTIDYPDPDGLRIMRVTWRVGILVPTADNAWTRCAGYAEYVLSALQDSPLPWLPVHVAPEVAIVQQGEVPGYRIDVVAELAASLVARRVPPPTVLLALATLTVTGRRIGIGHATVTLTATATLVVAASRVPPGSHNAAVAMTSAATLTVAGTKRAPKAGAVSMSSAGTLTVAATRRRAATAPPMTSAGTLTVAATRVPFVPWSPTSLPGLVAWYDASDAASITAAAGLVSQWSDKSGNGWHATQPTGTLQPTTGTRTVAGKNALLFGSGGPRVVRTVAFALGQPFTALAVIVAEDTGVQSLFMRGSGQLALSVGKEAAGAWRASCGTTITGGAIDAAAHVFETVLNGATSQLWVDGTSLAGPTNAGANTIDQGFGIGANNSNTAPGWVGLVAEVIVTSTAMATADRQAAEAYLKAKWGTP